MADLSELSNEGEYRPGGLPSRLPTLTGMRMVAAATVFLLHMTIWAFFPPDFNGTVASIVAQPAWAAVSFFFVLSGFVLTWSARPSDNTRSFYRRRALKIYPNHIIIAAVVTLLMFLWVGRDLGTFGDKPSAGTVVLNFLLLQGWSPDWMVRTALNPPAWSLSCELLFYLLFPVLFLLVRKIRPERLWGWAIGVAAVGVVAVPAIAATVIPHAVIEPSVGLSDPQFWFLVQFPPTRALEFLFGMLLARIVMTGRALPVGTVGGALAWTVGAYALTPFFPAYISVNALMFVPIGLLVARMAVADTNKERSWLSSGLMVRLGEISFAFYLWHQVVLMHGRFILGDSTFGIAAGLAVVLGLFAVALGLSYLIFTFVENPIMRRFSVPRRAAPVLEPVASAPPGENVPTPIRRAS